MAAVLLTLSLTSCSDNKPSLVADPATANKSTAEEPKPADSSTAASGTAAAAAPSGESGDIAEGKTLVDGADCLSCHKIDSKLVGPAYQDVAKKYTDADVDHLAQKVIDGGKGVWGDIPMTAHAGLSKDNAKKMVKYILSLKK